MVSYSSLVAVSILPVVATGWTVLAPLTKRCNEKAVLRSSPLRRNMRLKSKRFGPEEESFNHDDFGQMNPFGAAENSSSGADLAKDFFQEIRQRNQKVLEETSPSDNNGNGSAGSQANTNILSYNNVSMTDPSMLDDPIAGSTSLVVRRKFTGKPTDGQRSLFARDQITSSSVGQARTPREMMMEREYQLVRRAETGILGQAIVAVLALAFYIYVGLSGGIVSGRDAQMEDWGGDDEMPLEQLMPVQRDREVSIWL